MDWSRDEVKVEMSGAASQGRNSNTAAVDASCKHLQTPANMYTFQCAMTAESTGMRDEMG